MNLLDKRITITGGKGFLGQHLIARLKDRGFEHIAVADLPEYNLTKNTDVRKMYREQKPDIVIHLAAKVGGIGFNQQNPASLFYENAMMGIQLMHEGYAHHIDKFVALGTICAYPKFTPVPFHEEALWSGYPEETNAPYGLAKKMMLVQSQAYRQQYGFNSIFLLPVNLYGPGDNFTFASSHVIPALIRKFHLAQLLSRNDFDAIIRDFQFNKETNLVSDKKKIVLRKGSSPGAVLKVLSHFGISASELSLSVSPLPIDLPAELARPPQSRNMRDGGRSLRKAGAVVRAKGVRPSVTSTQVEVWGTGTATREFFYVEDAAEAIVLATEKYNKSEPVNIGAGFEISIKDLVTRIVELMDYKGKVVWDKTKPDGQPRRMLDTDRARKEFGFKAATGFRNGLEKTIEWYRRQ
jgi:nucleoside-diphosphate-sugar epimerase